LNTTADLDRFAHTYAQARARFQWAASQAGDVLHVYTHPSALGPDGGTFSIDVAVFGRPDARRALLILSGTHGGEGYTGSAAQIEFIQTGTLSQLPADVRVVMVHGINPYGFAHWTRTTENNVDLNRNFIDFSGAPPRNPAYLEVHPLLCPAQWDEMTLAQTQAQLDAWIAQHGKEAWTQTIMKGQYEEPTGLNYGGRAPEWSHLTLQTICSRHLAGIDRLAFIDWHTGLGERGQPVFLCFNDYRDAQGEQACRWWGRDRVETSAGFEGASRPKYTGLIFHGVQRFVAPAPMAGAVIEFGTLPVKESFDAVRLDRWRNVGNTPDNATLLADMRASVREANTPSELAWRTSVLAHARTIQEQALSGLASW